MLRTSRVGRTLGIPVSGSKGISTQLDTSKLFCWKRLSLLKILVYSFIHFILCKFSTRTYIVPALWYVLELDDNASFWPYRNSTPCAQCGHGCSCVYTLRNQLFKGESISYSFPYTYYPLPSVYISCFSFLLPDSVF